MIAFAAQCARRTWTGTRNFAYASRLRLKACPISRLQKVFHFGNNRISLFEGIVL